MKKIYLAVFLACSMGGAVNAQISSGGLPWGVSESGLNGQTVKVTQLKTPDFETAKGKYEEAVKAGVPMAYLGGLQVASDISIQNTGNMTFLEDGRKIWKAKIKIDGVQGINIYYDDFKLPAGVRYYITNENGKQLMGAFTELNNSDTRLFATSTIQGNTINLEMDIDATVKVSDISFHINRLGAIFRGEDVVSGYYGAGAEEEDALKPTIGESSTCHINAICPDGASYPEPRKATARIIIPIDSTGIGFCSGTLLNNAAGECKPYFLTASHCDGANVNGTTDVHFAQWIFNFNYEYPNCNGTGNVPMNRILTGGNFRARSKYPSSGGTNVKDAVADFILLELKDLPPTSWDVYLAGWNRSASVFTDPSMDYYIGFHHPAGDVKKLSFTDNIDPNGTFNQNAILATHWSLSFTGGVTEGGSSGSGLFDKNGRLIGDLSGGETPGGGCAPAGPDALYSKLSNAWNFSFDAPAGPATRLKEWLDPANSGVTTADARKIPCVVTSIEGINELGNSIMIYPNPANNYLKIRSNFNKPTNVQIEILDVVGRSNGIYTLSNVTNNEYVINTTGLSNGVYFVNIINKDNNSKISRKVVLNH